MYLSKDKAFYRLLLSLALPIAAQNILTFSISMADSLMVGFLGEIQLAAASQANRFFFFFMIILFGITGGANILIAQYWGKKDIPAIHQVMAIMYRVVIGLISAAIIVAQLFPEWVMSLFATDPAVIQEGAVYLKIVSWGYLLFGLTNATVMVLRSVRTVKISNVIYGTSLVTNVFFNWVLIFGRLGAPRLGVAGAAYATVISRVAELVVLLVFLWRYEDKLGIRLSKLLPVHRPMLQSFITNCIPVIANETIWVTGSTVVSMIIGRLGTTVIAASNIESIGWQLVTVALFGLQNSTSVIIGNTIGAGEKEKLFEYSRTLSTLGICVGIFAGVVMMLLRPLAAVVYPSFDPSTLEMARRLMINSAILLVFQGSNFTNLMGILRGGGDLRFVLVCDVIFLWTVSLPLGLAAFYLWHWPAPFTILILHVDEVIKAIVSLWRVRGNQWVRDLTITTS